MRIILVRHGEAESNKLELIGGQKDYGLTALGREQSKKVGESLKDERIDAAFCSTMKRARDTADEIMRYHPKTKIIFDKRLVEIGFGRLEGKASKEYWDGMKAAGESYEDFRPEGGENMHDLKERITPFVEELKKLKGNAMIIGHGRVLRMIVCMLTGNPIEDVRGMRVGNASITMLEKKGGRFEVDEKRSVGYIKKMPYVSNGRTVVKV